MEGSSDDSLALQQNRYLGTPIAVEASAREPLEKPEHYMTHFVRHFAPSGTGFHRMALGSLWLVPERHKRGQECAARAGCVELAGTVALPECVESPGPPAGLCIPGKAANGNTELLEDPRNPRVYQQLERR